MRLFLLSPATVLAARVNLATPVYPLDQIPFDGVTAGAYTAVAVGQTVLIGSAPGLSDYGRSRVRKAPTSTVLYVGRSSQGTRDGELTATDNAYLTVIDLYLVWAKIPYIAPDGTIHKDSDLVYNDQGEKPPPVANCGPGTAGTINSGTSLLTVAFNGAASFATADGATITTYLWNVADGAITVGTSASSGITAAFPAGFRWVSLTVTDSNGKVHTSRCPVYARNPAADTTVANWQMVSHRRSQAGQQISVKVLSDIPVATYPDGTLALIWSREPASPSDRGGVTFIGWHHTDPATITAQRTGTLKDTTLELLDVAGKLDTLPGFPQSIEYNNTPTSWLQMKAACMDRYLHHLLNWHSTALDLADFTWSGTVNTYPFVVLSSDGASLWQQVARRARSLVPNYVLSCNSLGQIRILVDPMLIDSGSRTSTVQAALDGSSFSQLRWTHQRPARAHWLRGNAIVASPTEINAVFCIAPGNAPAQGEAAQEQGEQLAVSQAALNAQEGHRYARLNAPESHFSISAASTGSATEPSVGELVEPADMSWVTLTLSAALAAQRGLSFTAARGLVHEVTIHYEQGRTGLVRSVELDWERETVGGPAVTELQEADQLPVPEHEIPPDNYDPTPPVLPPVGLGFGTVYVMTHHYLYRTRDFSASSPTWAIIATDTGLNMEHFVLDPWRPETTGFYCNHSGLYRSTDLDQVTPTWTQVVAVATLEAQFAAETPPLSFGNMMTQKIIMSINVQGEVVWFWNCALGTQLYNSHSTDYGDTWIHSSVPDPTHPASRLYSAQATDMVQSVPGSTLQYVADYGGDNFGQPQIYTGFEGSWHPMTQAGMPSHIPTGYVVCLHIPYNDNPDGDVFYFAGKYKAGVTPIYGNIIGSNDQGVSFFNASPVTDRGTTMAFSGIGSHTQNRQLMYAWVETNPNFYDGHLYTSDDGGVTWASTASAGLTDSEKKCGCSGFPYADGQFYLVTDSRILVSVDRGASWTAKTGSLAGSFSNEAYGHSVIVPLWTE